MKDALIQSIMTTNLITVSPYDTLLTVSQLFKEKNIHHLIVVEDDALSGIISSTDLERAKHGKSLFISKNEEGFEKALLESIMVGSIMTENATSVKETDTLYTAYTIFKENNYRCLPVKSESGKLVGLVTPMDLLHQAFNE